MKIKVEDDNKVKVIKLIGDLDGNSADKVRYKVMTLVDSEAILIFDMTYCEYISSAGLRTLLIIAKKLKLVGSYGALANLTEEVKDIMDMTGFSHILDSYSTVEEAKNYLAEKRNKNCASR